MPRLSSSCQVRAVSQRPTQGIEGGVVEVAKGGAVHRSLEEDGWDPAKVLGVDRWAGEEIERRRGQAERKGREGRAARGQSNAVFAPSWPGSPTADGVLVPHTSHVVECALDHRVSLAITVPHRVEEDGVKAEHMVRVIWIEDLAGAVHAFEAIVHLVRHLLACVPPLAFHACVVD